MPREIAGLAADLLDNPAQVSVAPVATTAERVDQQVIFVDGAAKRDVLLELVNDPAVTRAIVFTRTKRGADKVAQHLEAGGVGAHAIHGNKSQNQRVRALDLFKRGSTRVLVATDIAARGIDIDAVSHVFNYELPETPEAYVHRIGRTARAGATGRAISLCDNGERAYLRQIEKLTRQTLPSSDRRTAGGARDPEATSTRPPMRGRGGRPQPNREGGHGHGDPRAARPAPHANGQKRSFGGPSGQAHSRGRNPGAR